VKVIRSGILGFCEGVRLAVEKALQVSSSADRVYTLGPLIHNSRVLAALKERGVICLKEGEFLSTEPNSTVIIRAHGISPAVEREIVNSGKKIVDATCPHVKTNQKKANDFAKKGYVVFLAGEENHAEIEGLRGYVQSGIRDRGSGTGEIVPFCFIVSNPTEAEARAADLYNREPKAKTVLIGQTTISSEEYRAIGEKIRQIFPSLETVDSICTATAERQKALSELCGKVDAVVIVGSRESSNTQRLLALAQELNKPAWLAETAADLPPEIRAYNTVGISAGASTPDDLIDEVEEALKGQIH
jgi:4-hydroxy-3-methylbut-2-enyl diphosphate reductase